MKQKVYSEKNVYEALQDRLDFIFANFKHIYVSFSGGKDSGLLLNLVLDYKKSHNIDAKIGVFHQDFEAQYSFTTDYVTRTFENNLKDIDPYWVCLPMGSKTNISNVNLFWYPWDPDKKANWVRPMPKKPYVYNLDNNPFDFYKYKMLQEVLYKEFGYWYARQKGEPVICLLGMRADESLNRYRSIKNKVHNYKNQDWITDMGENSFSCAPLYDWSVEDVWTANAKFGYDYNKLYDMYYKAGLSVSEMRVASPFNEWALESLQLYRVIEPKTWTKLLGRIEGANFAAIYGRTSAMGSNGKISLPEGHTWESYTKFLLNTLPEDVRNNYINKFNTSINFWNKTGGGLDDDAIKEIISKGYDVTTNGISNYSKNHKTRLIFNGPIPDNTDDVLLTKDIPSWKRMCICILKNDHYCRYMGFGVSAIEQKLIDSLKEKYATVGE